MGSVQTETGSFTPSITKDESEAETSYSTLEKTAALTASGILGRVALQHIPSVEPLIAVAAASGFYFGAKEGIIAGASGYYISNFLVYGGQGPWTLFQVMGAAAAGLTGGLIGNISQTKTAFFGSATVGVITYQILVNTGSMTIGLFTGLGPAYLAAASPFILAHVTSTVAFGLILYGAKDKIGLYRKD